jgi:osmoprotectant transport system ATP-binding protein
MALVRDLMHRGVITCHPQTSIKEVARIMDANNVRSVVVTDDSGEVWGIVSLISILKAWGKDMQTMTAEDLVKPYTVTISPDSPVEEAVSLLQRKRVEHLVIMSPLRKAVGILTTFDIVQHMAGLHGGRYRTSMEIVD